MVGWATSFSLAMILNKTVTSHHPLITILWLRTLFGLTCILPFVRWKNLHKNWHYHMLRGLLLAVAMASTYASYRNLPIHTAAILGATGPFFHMLMAKIFLKEHIFGLRWVLLGVGFMAIVMEILSSSQQQVGGLKFLFLPLMANIAMAAAVILARKLLKKNVPPVSLISYGALVPFAVFSCVGARELSAPQFAAKDLFLFAMIGGFGALSQLCYVQALKYACVSFLAPFEYLRVVLLTLLSWVFFGKTPTWVSLLSAIMIICVCVWLARLDRRKVAE